MSKGVIATLIIGVILGCVFYFNWGDFSGPSETSGVSVAASKTTSFSRFDQINKEIVEYYETPIFMNILVYRRYNKYVGNESTVRMDITSRWYKNLIVFMKDDLKLSISDLTSYLELHYTFLAQSKGLKDRLHKRYGETPKFQQEMNRLMYESYVEYKAECEKLLGHDVLDKMLGFQNSFNMNIAKELKEKFYDFKVVERI